MAKPARQDCPLAVVAGVIGDTAVQVVDDPDLRGRGDQVEDQADGERLAQPRISTLGLGGTPDDDPTDGEEGNRDKECKEGLGGGWLSVQA